MKKAVALILCLVLLLSAAMPVAAEEKEYEGVMEVLQVNKKTTKDIVIDGVMQDGEWGNPVYTVTPREAIKNRNYNWDYYQYSEIPADQRVEIYATNDGANIYLACKLIGADYDAGSDSSARSDVQKHAHFGFTIAKYVEDTVVPIKPYKNDDYEHYTHYVMATVEGEKWSTSYSLGMTVVKLEDDQYNFTYDKASRTYTYEVCVPVANTEISWGTSTDVVMAFDIGDAMQGETAGNRYIISKGAEIAWRNLGAYNFPHAKSWPLLIQMLGNNEMDRFDFIPTEDEESIAASNDQVGFIEYDEVTRTQEAAPLLTLTEIVSMAVALVFVVATAVFFILRRKRS